MIVPAQFPKDLFQRIHEINQKIKLRRKEWPPERIWEVSNVQPLSEKELAEEMKKAFSSPIARFLWAHPSLRTVISSLTIPAIIVAVFALTGAMFWGWRESTEVAIQSVIVLIVTIAWIVMAFAVSDWDTKYSHIASEDMTPFDEENLPMMPKEICSHIRNKVFTQMPDYLPDIAEFRIGSFGPIRFLVLYFTETCEKYYLSAWRVEST